MVFEFLAERIDKVPLIICGPIVRHSHDKGVSVWLALSKPVETVALSIFGDVNGLPGELLAFDTEPTLSFGKHLHIVTITAPPIVDEEPLVWGTSYLYDVAFDAKKPGGFKSLRDDAVLESINDITYHEHGYRLPSFVLPPKNVNKLHFIQCSCRDTKGAGVDAMPALDDILLQNWTPSKRPQQLFLTGDQIYADEVNVGLLYLITDAAKFLLAGRDDWEETLPLTEEPNDDKSDEDTKPNRSGVKASDFGPNTRRSLVREHAGFTTKSGESHLLSLGEFLAMYLLIWSDTLWPKLPKDNPQSALPSAEKALEDWIEQTELDYQNKLKEIKKESQSELQNETNAEKRKAIKEDTKKKEDAYVAERDELINKTKANYVKKITDLIHFREGIRKIRRGLANITTYMVFDDHEVTDDWHLNREWVEEVYKAPLGRRILKNALAAFAVCQAWGNTPDRYSLGDTSEKPTGQRLLEAISEWISARCVADHPSETTIGKLVNIPKGSEIKKFAKEVRKGKIPVSEEAVRWHFSVQHPSYHAIFTDARSQRAVPDKRYRPSEHLSEEAILEQIPLTEKAPEFTLLISPCNLVTINYFRNWVGKYVLPAFRGVASLLEGIGRHNVLANDPDLADSWVVQSKAFENVISRLASRIPIKDGKRRTRLVVLSGDVHFSATMRMQYWSNKPFRIYLDDPTKDSKANIPKDSPAEFVMAHLICSAVKNEVGIFHFMHYLGFEVDDFLNNKENLPFPEVFLGYHKKAALGDAKRNEILLNTRWFAQYRPSLIRQEPVLIPFHRRDKNIKFPNPDWHYRFDAIRGESLAKPAEDPQDVPGFFKSLASHSIYSKNKVPGLEIMSINNIAEFDFSWTGEGVLTQAMSFVDQQCELEIVKNFPNPPFQIIIEDEAIAVLELEVIQPIINFRKLRRGIDNTKAVDHQVGTKVAVRKTINQTHWIVEKDNEQQTKSNGTTEGMFPQKSARLTRFVVPMEFEDPKYTEPEIPIEQTDA